MNEASVISTIGQLFDVAAGKTMSKAARGGGSQHPFLRTSNIGWGRVDVRKIDTMSFSEEEIRTKTLKPGDLLVCEGGEIGKAAVWNGEIGNCGFQNHLHRLRPRSDEVVPRFYMYYLQAGFTQLGIYEGAGNKTTIPNLSRSRLEGLAVPPPNRTEHAKIAAVLWKAQRAIETEEKLIATACELKQSVLRQLFSRGLRGEPQKETEIGPIPESWEIRPFQELREFLQYGTSAKCDYHGKGNPVIRIPNITGGAVDTADLKWCELSDREVTSLQLNDGDLLFVRTNGVRERVGSCAVYHEQPKGALFASYLIRARLKVDELNPDFFQYYSMTPAGKSFLAGRASPAADGKFNINTKTIDAVLVPVPPSAARNEQDEIVAVLKTIDRKISIHERKRATLQELFKTLLHKLMTGQIRIDKLDIDTSEVTI